MQSIRLVRADFYIENIYRAGVLIPGKDRALYIHNEGKPLTVGCVAKGTIRCISGVPFPGEIRTYLEIGKNGLGQTISLR